MIHPRQHKISREHKLTQGLELLWLGRTLYLWGKILDCLSPCENVRNLGHFWLTAEP
jgi:hypothetical protein